jgi:outer membrane protein assembly factor BamD (BamD/ComL family)
VIVGGTDGLGKWSALNESLPGRIFISYRRQETAWPAGRLYDVLVEHFPAEQVFKDVDNIDPGDDFVERITGAVASCDVLLALIGPDWLTITDENGQRRLDKPEDYVRVEIETALKRKIRVIPILVDPARMPHANQLPPTMAPLARRNAVEINPITFDTRRLIATVRKTLAELQVSDNKPDRPNQQVAGPEVEQLYDRALAAFWTEQWDEAVDLLGQILSRRPGYADAARKLEVARRQQELASHYAQASAAADAGDWEQAVAQYSMVAEADPDYRDTNGRLADARQQHQLATLQAEAERLHRAGQWAAVIKVGEQLQAIDPAAADPDGLMTSARAELAAQQRAAALAADYHNGLRLFDAGRWEEAIAAFERVTRLDSTYQDVAALLGRSRRELEKASATLVEERAQREAEEQAQRQAETEEQARRQAETEEQAQRQAQTEEQAQRQAEEQGCDHREKEAEDHARQQKEAEDRARQLGEEQTRRQEEEAARRLRKEQRRRDTHQMLRSMRQRAARLLSRRWLVVVLAVSVCIGGALLLLIHVLRTPPIMGQLPPDLRASCSAKGTSATCLLPDRTVVLYRLFDSAAAARTDVVNGNELAPNGTPCPPSAPVETTIVCSYVVGAETGVAAFSQTVKLPAQFYEVRWNPNAHPRLRGVMTRDNTTAQDWESLLSNWTRLAGMH